MNLTAASLDNTRFVGVVLAGLAIMGLTAYESMSRDDMPPYTIRFASIVTSFPGASPERVESLVTDPLEEVVQELPEVDNITSDSRTGLSVISVELRQDEPKQDLQKVWDRLRRKIDVAASDLPDTAGRPQLKDDSLGVVYGIVVGLQNDGFSYDELEDYAEDLRDRILLLEDASEVKISGAQPPQIYADYDPERLAQLGLTAGMLRNILASTNILYPGGSVVLGEERVILEPTGNFSTIEQLRETLVPLPSGGTIALGDIATVTRGYKTPAQTRVRVDGKPGITLSVALRSGANLIRLGEKVDELVQEAQQDFPMGISVFRVAFQDVEVDKSIADFMSNLLQAVGVVLAVMLVMLGLRTGVVVASLIPMTMLLTLFVMSIIGQGLNQVTLAGLIMALGMLVDNAIVVSESIMVEMERGKSPPEAAIQTASELALPLLISSLTTSAAFVAFYLAESLMGEIVGPLFVVITIALISSWVLALTLIPLLVVAFVRPKKDKKESAFLVGLRSGYARLVKTTLRWRWVTIVTGVAMLFMALASFGSLPFIFFPDSERPLIQVDVKLPLGTRIEASARAATAFEEFIAENLQDHVKDVSSFVGEGPPSYDLGYHPDEPSTNYLHLLVNTNSGEDNQPVIDGITQFAVDNLPNAQTKARRLGGGGGGPPIEIRIWGPEMATLYELAETTKRKLQETPGSRSVSDDWGPQIKKFSVAIRQNELQRAGLTNEDVALSLQTVLTGYGTGEFREADESVTITMRAADATEYQVEDIRNTTIYPASGGDGVPLSQVADVKLAWQYPRIRRRDLRRTLTIESYLTAGTTAQDVMGPVTAYLEEARKTWPPGYDYELGGESEDSEEGMGSVAEKLPVGFGAILFLLVFQFNSLRKTWIVLTTVPLGLIGVVAGLHLFGSYFGFFAFLGTISLAGIVINNAIVLLDRIRIEEEENGHPPHEAIVVACGHRLRPILLTTLTTTLGLIPLYLGGGTMWEPLAIAIMIGLLFGTLITLVFVPAMYSLLYRTARTAQTATTAK